VGTCLGLYLFPSLHRRVYGGGFGEKVISDAGLYQIVAKYADSAGVQGVRPHDLRRTFAMLAFTENNADLRAIQKALGHASIRTTEDYLQER
jgi:integrase